MKPTLFLLALLLALPAVFAVWNRSMLATDSSLIAHYTFDEGKGRSYVMDHAHCQIFFKKQLTNPAVENNLTINTKFSAQLHS